MMVAFRIDILSNVALSWWAWANTCSAWFVDIDFSTSERRGTL